MLPDADETQTLPAMGRRHAARGLSLWAANLGVMAAGFVAPLALARLATPDDYGRFSFVTATLATCSILTAPGLGIAVTQAAARGQHGVLRHAVRTRTRWSALAALVTAALGLWVFFERDRTTGVMLLLTAPLMIAAFGLDLATAFLNGSRQYRGMVFTMLAAAAVPALTVAAMLWLGASIVAATLGYFVSLSACNIVSLGVVRRRFVENDASDPELIRYGQRLSWISSVGAVQFYVDRLVIGLSLGFADLAVYSVAKIFQQGFKATWVAVNQQLFPSLSSRAPHDAAALNRRTLLPITGGLAALFAVAALVTPAVVTLLFGPGYEASATPARILMLAFVLGVPGAQFEMLFRATGDERSLYIQRGSFAVIEVCAAGIGALLYGVTGASVGMLIAYVCNTITGFLLDRYR